MSAPTEPFGPDYAEAYDLLYDTKDYDAECRFIQAAAAHHGHTGAVRVLDLGCGTGAHALRLAAAGYAVTGVDRSAPMLARARVKAAASPAATRLRFEQGDIGGFRTDDRFDVALMMFAVLGYQTDDAALRAALDTARIHLGGRGLFIFDCWYGPAVIAQRPGERTKQIDHPTGTLVRVARSALDADRRLCTVHYDLRWTPRDGVPRTTQEAHPMRFFFPDELDQQLARAGFALRTLVDFEAPEKPASPDSWNVWCVAEAV